MAESTESGGERWTKERVEKLLASESFRYQNIELPHGLSTGGYDRSSTAARIFPEDLSGKSVLDLGCSFGYFTFEAERRGAKRVLGIDVDPDSVRKARLLAECKGSRASFECRDLERDLPDEAFDYVLGLNILHHLRDPIAALDRLISITRERLILEVATLGKHDKKKTGVSALARFFLRRTPTIVVTRSGTRGKREIQKFYITPGALENLLIYQRGMFARLETFASEHKGRFITVALKRRIGHLLVVSSPTSAGKKTIMRRLTAGALPELAERLGTPDGSVWGKPFNANRIFEPDEPRRERMMLHHDFLRPYLRSTMTHERDEANDIFSCAERLTFLTIWTPPERLVRQITEAEIEPRAQAGKKPSKRHLRIREDYKNPARVVEHYKRWFDYTAKISEEHIVASYDDQSDRLTLRTVSEWESLTRDLAGSAPTP